MKVDLQKFRALEEEGWLRSQMHPSLSLTIWNYSEHCQYEKHWTDETLMCRGLVTDPEGNIVARPFKKFFNYEEHTGSLPEGTPQVIEKVDGSLGIIFWYDGKWHVATRGSFISDQAVHAQGVLGTKYREALEQIPKDHTHLFEIIYPTNRIVVDYGGTDDLVYLGSVRTDDGAEPEAISISSVFKQPKRIADGGDGWSVEHLRKMETPNEEGFVLRWPNGFRLKLKFEEYKRLHRILTQMSNLALWEMMLKKQPIDEILEKVPDEFYDWVKKTMGELEHQYSYLQRGANNCIEMIQRAHNPQTRKEWAEHILEDSKTPGLCFNVLDKKDSHEAIMRLIRPTFSKPFKAET